MNKAKKIGYFVLVIVLLVAAVLCGIFVYRSYKRANPVKPEESEASTEVDISQLPPEYQDVGEELGKVGNIAQPEGFGVERPITDYGTSETQSDVGSVDTGGLGSIKVDPIEDKDPNEQGGIDPATILGPIPQTIKEDVATYIEKDDDEKYRTYVSWTNQERRRFSEENYYIVLIAVSKILEDKLNANDPGRYRVVPSMPNVERLEVAGLYAYWEIDDYGYLSIVGDFITQDLKSQTEVEEVKVYTVYYEGEYLTIKE